METVLVTDKEYDKGRATFSACPDFLVRPAPSDEKSLADAVRCHSARCVIVGVEKYTGPLYDVLGEFAQKSASGAALIARFGVGHDGVDKIRAKKLGIAVTNTPGVLSCSVAEHAFWLLGALLRNVVKGDTAMRRGDFPSTSGFELYGKTLLVVGTGEIGRHVAKIARFGFGMRVLGADSRPIKEIAERAGLLPDCFLSENGIERYSPDVDSLLPEADVVSLHLASTPETFHFMSKARFEAMKPEAVLVNTARGPVVDEAALFDALSSGRIAGAGLDVFETEPYRPVTETSDLRTLDNVVLTPHLGSSSAEANRRMAEATLRNARLFFARSFSEMNLVGD